METFFHVTKDGSGEYVYHREQPAEIQLDRQSPNRFKLIQQFGYEHHEYDEVFVIPRDTTMFTTDLASVPRFAAWLVPLVGTHLPATLLHDVLVLRKGEPKAHDGPDVLREQADELYRDAMKQVGTSVLRRHIIWAAALFWTRLLNWKERITWPRQPKLQRVARFVLPALLTSVAILLKRRVRLFGVLLVIVIVLLIPVVVVIFFLALVRIIDIGVTKANDGKTTTIDKNLNIGRYANGRETPAQS